MRGDSLILLASERNLYHGSGIAPLALSQRLVLCSRVITPDPVN